jgi:hypothetical protein
MHTGDLFDFGPQADAGILTILLPKLEGAPYPAYVPPTLTAEASDIRK